MALEQLGLVNMLLYRVMLGSRGTLQNYAWLTWYSAQLCLDDVVLCRIMLGSLGGISIAMLASNGLLRI